MHNITINARFVFIVLAIALAAIFRLVPHWPNFTPIAAIALFGGTYLRQKYLAFIIPLAALFISDLIIGFHAYIIAVYLSFTLVVMLGFYLRRRLNAIHLAGASLLSSILFFFITNYAVWFSTPFYSSDMQGLVTCYVAGIPFFYNGLLGDLFYNAVLFGSFYLVTSRYPALATE